MMESIIIILIVTHSTHLSVYAFINAELQMQNAIQTQR